ncbi:unnamed protein product [Cyclocybe aegerita]|uniref:Uncharacterized protein n=1 Tax=Cyclocybe aegerita TaxID=1973307 RepID=A0A8S0VXQ1_CYCAE|nr:unnamed protein product [Cyclocybe aegerita]
MWIDSLPIAAKAIRDKGKLEELDFADILDIKYMIAKERNADVFQLAKKAIKRNPEQAYFYYAIAVRSEDSEGLRAAKKGLKCKQIVPFLQHMLLMRAVEHAGTMGLRLLEYGPSITDDGKLEEAAAFLTSALEDAKMYLSCAMPDSRHMQTVGSWAVLLTLVLKDALSPDLRELDEIVRKIDIGRQFSNFMGITAPRLDLYATQAAAIKYYASGLNEFSRIFNHLEEGGATKNIPSVNCATLDDDLAAWLENVHIEGGGSQADHHHHHGGNGDLHSKVNIDNVALYRCSWCGNPSAVLRKLTTII